MNAELVREVIVENRDDFESLVERLGMVVDEDPYDQADAIAETRHDTQPVDHDVTRVLLFE